ncbi:UNVERIFIED_CONTAM: hypothetical protein HDU68_009035 [Siphonaria sp. JEL0065]|nr:hypothetical protein HDU68_009035 [Siphonaria sp. JEL0065]
MNADEREDFTTMLMAKVDFNRADIVLECWMMLKHDVEESHALDVKLDIGRENLRVKVRRLMKSSKTQINDVEAWWQYKTLEDIRDYKVGDFVEVCRVMDNCCVITGIDDEPRSIDR